MNRATITLAGLALFLVTTPLASSQDASPQPCPEVTSQALGCEPVAWSGLQEPVPLPEPDTKPEPHPDQQRDPQPVPSSSSPPTSAQAKFAWYRIFLDEGKQIKGSRETAPRPASR